MARRFEDNPDNAPEKQTEYRHSCAHRLLDSVYGQRALRAIFTVPVLGVTQNTAGGASGWRTGQGCRWWHWSISGGDRRRCTSERVRDVVAALVPRLSKQWSQRSNRRLANSLDMGESTHGR